MDTYEKYSSFSLYICLPGEQIALGATWYVYYKQLIALFKIGNGLDKKMQVTVMTALNLMTGGYRISCITLLDFIRFMRDAAENQKQNKSVIWVHFVTDGDISHLENVSDGIHFLNKSKDSTTRRVATDDIQQNRLP